MFAEVLPFLIILPPLAYGFLSLYAARSFFSRGSASAAGCGEERAMSAPPVSILKPVKGMDARSFESFSSFCRQQYPSFQIIFAAASADDPVITVIRQLIAEFPHIDMELVVDDRIYGPNYKVCNLINAFPRAKHDILIVCDSDIHVPPDYLTAVCSPFADPKVGLVTSLYCSSATDGVATAVEALGFCTEMIPNVMTAVKLEGLTFALGASMAVRRDALAAIGGFEGLVGYLADDYQLGNKIHKAGYLLELSDCFVESVMHREALRTVLSRQLRWARTMRVSRPGGYLTSGLTQPALSAMLSLIAGWGSPSGVVAVVLLYGGRCLVATLFSRRFVRDNLLPRYLWLLPLRDLLASATWALSFLGSRVRWRGNLFQVLPNGEIREIGGGM